MTGAQIFFTTCGGLLIGLIIAHGSQTKCEQVAAANNAGYYSIIDAKFQWVPCVTPLADRILEIAKEIPEEHNKDVMLPGGKQPVGRKND